METPKKRKTWVGIMLFLLSKIGKASVGKFLYVHGFVAAWKRGELGEWHYDLAIAYDQYGNVLGKHYFNKQWIKPHSPYKFGNPDRTISSTIGENKRENLLLKEGKIIDNILEKFEHNHSIKSIEE